MFVIVKLNVFYYITVNCFVQYFLTELYVIIISVPQDLAESARVTYFSEYDVFLVDHSGRCGAASAVHKPASISNQNHIRLLHRLRQTAGQCVPHLVLQGPSIGVDLKTDGMIFMHECDKKLPKILQSPLQTLYLVAQELARQGPEGLQVKETARKVNKLELFLLRINEELSGG